jgi:hypothetical protein
MLRIGKIARRVPTDSFVERPLVGRGCWWQHQKGADHPERSKFFESASKREHLWNSAIDATGAWLNAVIRL